MLQQMRELQGGVRYLERVQNDSTIIPPLSTTTTTITKHLPTRRRPRTRGHTRCQQIRTTLKRLRRSSPRHRRQFRPNSGPATASTSNLKGTASQRALVALHGLNSMRNASERLLPILTSNRLKTSHLSTNLTWSQLGVPSPRHPNSSPSRPSLCWMTTPWRVRKRARVALTPLALPKSRCRP